MHSRCFKNVRNCFPLGYYEGVSILIDVDTAVLKNTEILKIFHIDLQSLLAKLKHFNSVYLLRATKQIEHICLEMYDIDNVIKLDYLKIKVLELLVFLANNDFEMMVNQKRYYSKKQIETIKEIKQYMCENMHKKHDLNTLAAKFCINVHTLRKAFKEIYNRPIYQWFKEYRLEYSKDLLLDTKRTVIEIANDVGYVNPSKYAAAFYSYVGMTPQKFRKSNIKMD